MTSQYRALLSVSDKTGLTEFAAGLIELGFELISTGGTANALRAAGLAVTDVSQVTGFPEIMDGRVKTLHPSIHGALLGRDNIDTSVAGEHGIKFIDLLAVNLYPFSATIARPDCALEDAIENIDIGGPAMLRAAAKNHARVTVVVDPNDYRDVLDTLRASENTQSWRMQLATKAFTHTASYDSAISRYLTSRCGDHEPMPATLLVAAQRAAILRYGENPHQRAALYLQQPERGGTVATARQLQGKELSYNNIGDADAAVQCVRSLFDSGCVIVKHANPCGVALAAATKDAYARAYECDPVSAFGGIIAFNRAVDGATAMAIVEQQFAEVVVAPKFDSDASAALATKKNIRVLELGDANQSGIDEKPEIDIRTVEGGWLVQERDQGNWDSTEYRVVSKKQPSAEQLADLQFAATVAKYVKSNAIVYASSARTLGIGAGQMSRVDSARIAALKAEEAGLSLAGAVMASDAFFPFRDAVDTAADRGISAIVHPGGSIHDDEIVAAADEHGITMVMTGMRHFRH